MTQEPETEKIGLSEPSLHLVAGYAALAGICPLIPIPFVDDMIVRRIHRRLCQKLAERSGFDLSKEAAKSIVLWPVKKIIRKVVYVLAIKSCADVATAIFHDGWLFARALEQKYVDHDALARGDKETLLHLRDGIVEARDRVDPNSTRQIMQTAFGVGREVFDTILSAIRHAWRDAEGAREDRVDAVIGEVSELTRRIEDELRKHWSLGPELDRALRNSLDIGPGPDDTPN